MAMLIKGKNVADDPWVKIENNDVSLNNADSFSILPLSTFSQTHNAPYDLTLLIQQKPLGTWFNADVDTDTLTPEILSLPLLCINVDDFNHGQIFSLASMIKQNFNYSGELRATGNLILDQLPHLYRCGIDSFSLPNQFDWEYALFLLQQAPAPSRFQTLLNHSTLGETSL